MCVGGITKCIKEPGEGEIKDSQQKREVRQGVKSETSENGK